MPPEHLLSAEQILSVDTLKYEEHEVEEWGGTCRLRGLPSSLRETVLLEMVDENQKAVRPLLTAKIVAYGVVDRDGKRVFSDEQISNLAGQDPKLLSRLADRIFDLSGLPVAPDTSLPYDALLEGVRAAAEALREGDIEPPPALRAVLGKLDVETATMEDVVAEAGKG